MATAPPRARSEALRSPGWRSAGGRSRRPDRAGPVVESQDQADRGVVDASEPPPLEVVLELALESHGHPLVEGTRGGGDQEVTLEKLVAVLVGGHRGIVVVVEDLL